MGRLVVAASILLFAALALAEPTSIHFGSACACASCVAVSCPPCPCASNDAPASGVVSALTFDAPIVLKPAGSLTASAPSAPSAQAAASVAAPTVTQAAPASAAAAPAAPVAPIHPLTAAAGRVANAAHALVRNDQEAEYLAKRGVEENKSQQEAARRAMRAMRAAKREARKHAKAVAAKMKALKSAERTHDKALRRKAKAELKKEQRKARKAKRALRKQSRKARKAMRRAQASIKSSTRKARKTVKRGLDALKKVAVSQMKKKAHNETLKPPSVISSVDADFARLKDAASKLQAKHAADEANRRQRTREFKKKIKTEFAEKKRSYKAHRKSVASKWKAALSNLQKAADINTTRFDREATALRRESAKEEADKQAQRKKDRKAYIAHLKSTMEADLKSEREMKAANKAATDKLNDEFKAQIAAARLRAETEEKAVRARLLAIEQERIKAAAAEKAAHEAELAKAKAAFDAAKKKLEADKKLSVDALKAKVAKIQAKLDKKAAAFAAKEAKHQKEALDREAKLQAALNKLKAKNAAAEAQLNAQLEKKMQAKMTNEAASRLFKHADVAVAKIQSQQVKKLKSVVEVQKNRLSKRKAAFKKYAAKVQKTLDQNRKEVGTKRKAMMKYMAHGKIKMSRIRKMIDHAVDAGIRDEQRVKRHFMTNWRRMMKQDNRKEAARKKSFDRRNKALLKFHKKVKAKMSSIVRQHGEVLKMKPLLQNLKSQVADYHVLERKVKRELFKTQQLSKSNKKRISALEAGAGK